MGQSTTKLYTLTKQEDQYIATRQTICTKRIKDVQVFVTGYPRTKRFVYSSCHIKPLRENNVCSLTLERNNGKEYITSLSVINNESITVIITDVTPCGIYNYLIYEKGVDGLLNSMYCYKNEIIKPGEYQVRWYFLDGSIMVERE